MNFYHAINPAFPRWKSQILRIMKITTFLLLISFLTVSAGTLAQKITINEKRVNLEEIFDKIRLQSGYNIIYSGDLLSKTRPVNISISNMSVEDALKTVLQTRACPMKSTTKPSSSKSRSPRLSIRPKPISSKSPFPEKSKMNLVNP